MELGRTMPAWMVGVVVLVAVILPLASSSARAQPATGTQAAPSAPPSAVAASAPFTAQTEPLAPPVPPSVGQTTVLFNNTVYPGLYRSVDTDVAGYEDWGTTPAYDPTTNLFYEPVQNYSLAPGALYYGGYLAAVSPATDRLVQLIPIGYEPMAVTFDSSNGLLYVLNWESKNIGIVDPSTNEAVGTLALPSGVYPIFSMAVNNSSGHLFLGSSAGVYDLNITNDATVLITGSYQSSSPNVVFDNQTGEVYSVSSEVQVIGPNNDTVWKSVSLPATPSPGAGAPTVDWKTDELYVPWDNHTSAVELATNTLGPTLTLSAGEGVAPAATFDPDNGMVYVVTDYPNYNVTELNPATHRWVASSPAIPATPWGGIAYSPSSQRLLLTGASAGSSGFLLMSPTMQLVGQPLIGAYPFDPYFDPSTGDVFVSEYGLGDYGNVSALDAATGKVLGYVPAGLSPRAVWVDPSTGYGYIANFGPPPAGHVSNLTVFNAHTLAATGSIPVGTDPSALTYDPTTGYLYVVNSGTANITIINPVTNLSVGSIAVTGLSPVTASVYDPATSFLYVLGGVGGEDYGEIDIVDPATASVVGYAETYFEPFSETYDAATQLIYIEDTNSSVFVLQKFDPGTGSFVGSINLYHTSLNLAWDSANDLVYAPDEVNDTNGANGNVVTEVNVTSGTLVNLTVGQVPYGIAIDASTGEAFVSDEDSGDVVFINPGTPAAPTYTVTFETVPTSCTITFNGVTYTSGQEATGVAGGSYTIVAPACTGETFSSWSSTVGTVTSPTSASTTVTVSASGTLTATFTATTTTYTVTFQTVPTSCSITFNGVTYTNGQQASGVAAGSYSLVAPACAGEVFSSWSSSAGTVASSTSASTTVTISSDGTITATFTAAPPETYLITFTETGLPTGTSWSVTLEGTPMSSTTDTLQFSEGNDTYSFTVGVVSGYSAAPSSGSVVVNGGPVSKEIAFTASTTPPPSSSSSGILGLSGWEGYGLLGGVAALLLVLILLAATRRHKLPIVFTEVGLPPGTRWSVALDGNELSADLDVIMFTVHGGTHMYRVGSSLGFTPSPAAGTVELKRERIDVRITFAPPARKS